MPEEATTSSPPQEKSCRCGHNRKHHMVSAEGKYTFSGYLRLFFGISARPTRVSYRCRKCNQTFDSTTSAKVLDEHY
ncbi:MAG: hypothetical protein IPM54_18270 [Polyangiaceae bacterium]|nr:hypothetical protein [Polyangiaceae bacterium]